jgi:hypothetical protein
MSAAMTYVTWRKEHLWHVSVLQRVDLSNPRSSVGEEHLMGPSMPVFLSEAFSLGDGQPA